MKSMQTKVREALTAAGHGAVSTDTHGGDGLIGFFTFPMSWERVFIGFAPQVGQSFRFPAEVMAGLTRPMLERYASTLREAGIVVGEYGGGLQAHAGIDA